MSKKNCYFTINKIEPDFRDLETLKKFLSPRGKILPSMISKVSLKYQRRLSTAIKRARFLALIPYTSYQSEKVKMRTNFSNN